MSKRSGLGWNNSNLCCDMIFFTRSRKKTAWWFNLKTVKSISRTSLPLFLTFRTKVTYFFGCLSDSHTNVALVELYQGISISFLTAVGLRPLWSKNSPIPLIESPLLPQFPFDSDQAQKPLSHFLTLLILRQSRKRWHLLNLLHPLFEASGDDSATSVFQPQSESQSKSSFS